MKELYEKSIHELFIHARNVGFWVLMLYEEDVMEIISGSVYAKTGARKIKGHLIIQVAMGMDILAELCDPSNGGGFIHELQVPPFKVTPQPWGVWDGQPQLGLEFEGERSARREDLSGKVEKVLDVVRRWEEYYVEDYPEWEFRVE